MTINKISGGKFGGIQCVFIDFIENVTDVGVIPNSFVEIPIRESTTSVKSTTQVTKSGKHYEIKLEGFSSGIDETNLAAFEAFNDRKIIAWFTDFHDQQLAIGTLTEPARILIDSNFPEDHTKAMGFQFTITSKQTVGLTVL
jgi:hypothetical protein